MRIKYMHKMGKTGGDFLYFNKEDIPEDIIEILTTNEKFKKSGSFGQKGLGKPEEIESLTIIDSDGTEKYSYHNKCMHYAFSNDQSMQPVFKAFTHFMIKHKQR
ncbi:hypothetical protein QA601_03925 [Chitinispirillales bacterium ANBcel5]|uniref:hypothetical protein n=1 Tax=Cellulosispirillum alkaliphilum TaxID=3039283 RepID=UPI002A52AD29|nr:hypothetical protein [Chitinispirillales bacterium ANBcel5]